MISLGSGESIAREKGIDTNQSSISGKEFIDAGLPILVNCARCGATLTFLDCFVYDIAGITVRYACKQCKDHIEASI